MSKEKIDNIIKELQQIKLTQEERSALFADLNKYADSHLPKFKNEKVIRSPYVIFYKHVFNVSVSVLACILVFGSTVFASKSSLPGDILYAVKRKVSEPLEVAFAKTAEDEGLVYVAHVEERLKEAEILAVQGTLATSTARDLGESIENQTDLVRGSDSKENQDDFDVQVEAHSAILEKILKYSDEGQKTHINNIIKSANNKNRHKDSRDENKDDIKKEDTEKVFIERKNTIEKVIQDETKNIEENRKDNDDELSKDILDNAQNSIDEAKSNLNEAVKRRSKSEKNEDDEEYIKNSERSAKKASISVKRGLELGKIRNRKK